MSKIITNEQELNTAVEDLITEDYALEILGLKNIADFRKFSRSFMKLSKIVKKIENSDNNKSEKGHLHDDRYYTEAEVNNELAKKLNKGTVSSEYDTAKKIEDKIKGIDEKFKNFCPFKVGDIYVTTNSANPSSVYLGTTWSKIEGRFLLGTSGEGASKQTGGSMAKTIQQVNMPNIKLQVDSFSVTTPNHAHKTVKDTGGRVWNKNLPWARDWYGSVDESYFGRTADGIADSCPTSNDGGGTTSTASPQTSALGNGQALDITPAYYTTHMWLRTS